MKISCNECRQQLGELIDSALAGEIAAGADAREHVAACAECRRDLTLLRAARDEMRAFPNIAAPPNLRERVRAQIALESTPLVAKAPATDLLAARKENKTPISQKSSQHRNSIQNRNSRNRRNKLIAFFQRPSNFAWSGGVAIALFWVVLLTSQDRRQIFEVQPQTAPSSSREYSGSERKRAGSATTAKSAPAKAPRPKLPSATKTPQPFPMVQPPSPTDSFPQNGNTVFPGGSNHDLNNLPRVSPPNQNADPAMQDSFEKPNPKRDVSPSADSETSAANLPATALSKKEKPAEFRQNGSSNSPAAPPANEQTARDESFDSAAGVVNSNGATATAEKMQSRSAKSVGPGNFGKSNDEDAQPSISAPSIPAPSIPAPSIATPSTPQSPRAMILREQPKASAPVSRRVVARIVAPRDMNWGQLSVVLPEGVRFRDGSRARVVWRGAIGAGEKIIVPFNVRAASGSHSIRLSLQEVRNGEAQTLASDSVSVSGR